MANAQKILFPDIEEPDGEPPANIPGLNRRKLEDALYIACEELLKVGENAQEQVCQAYVTALQNLTWPSLLPFYRALNPELAQKIGL